MADVTPPLTTDSQTSGPKRPGWVVPAVIVGVLVVVGVVVALIALNGGDDGSADAEPVIAVDLSETEIRVLQGNLADLGYYDGPINGVYNQKTFDAVAQLQADLGVTVDGVYGPETDEALQRLLSDENPPSSTTAPSPTTTASSPDTTNPPSGQPVVTLTIDGADGQDFVVTRCENSGETDLSLEAETQGDSTTTKLEVEAIAEEGTIRLSGAVEAEGTVDQLVVGDTGMFEASGVLSIADDSSDPTSYELTGTCS